MTDQYTGRARITNKQTGASREGVVTARVPNGIGFREDGTGDTVFHIVADFAIEPILPEIPSEPGDTFTAEVTQGRETTRVLLMSADGYWRSATPVAGFYGHVAEGIDRATIDSVITAKERGL